MLFFVMPSCTYISYIYGLAKKIFLFQAYHDGNNPEKPTNSPDSSGPSGILFAVVPLFISLLLFAYWLLVVKVFLGLMRLASSTASTPERAIVGGKKRRRGRHDEGDAEQTFGLMTGEPKYAEK